MDLALFDFDGTVTHKDTYTKFILSTTPLYRLVLGFCLLWPFLLMYKLGWLPPSALRPMISTCAFWRRDIQTTKRLAERFVTTYIPKVIRKQALERIKWHQKRGDQVVIVSAGLDVYLSIWCQSLALTLICSELNKNRSRYTGHYLHGDCSKAAKARRVKQQFSLSAYRHIYAYGDSQEDLALLSLADTQFYQWNKVN